MSSRTLKIIKLSKSLNSSSEPCGNTVPHQTAESSIVLDKDFTAPQTIDINKDNTELKTSNQIIERSNSTYHESLPYANNATPLKDTNLQLASPLSTNNDSDYEAEPYSSDSDLDPTYHPSEEKEENIIDQRKKMNVVRKVFVEVVSNQLDKREEGLRQSEKKSRKRKRTPHTWEKNLKKEKRLVGEEYVNRGGKVVKKKILKASCRCRMKCYDKIDEENRKKIHEKFWSLRSWDQRKQFVMTAVTSEPVARNRSRNGRQQGRRQKSYKYSFKLNNDSIPVCKVMFLNTLSLGEKFLRNSVKHGVNTSIASPDKRQMHEPTRLIRGNAKVIARSHIESFPALKSHYTRSKSSRKYLEPGLNLRIMYNLYKEYCAEKNIDEKDIVKESYYRFLFNTEYNFSFKVPSLDTCDDCDKYERQLLDAREEELKVQIRKERDLHHAEAEKRYKTKEEDKLRSRFEHSRERVCTMDLQKCLPTPCLTNALSFYKLKLWTFNFTICDMTTLETSCMLWNESSGRRGSNEIASCIFKWI